MISTKVCIALNIESLRKGGKKIKEGRNKPLMKGGKLQ